jgi:hypothetical protein
VASSAVLTGKNLVRSNRHHGKSDTTSVIGAGEGIRCLCVVAPSDIDGDACSKMKLVVRIFAKLQCPE